MFRAYASRYHPIMTDLPRFALSLLMIATFALAAGGVYLIVKRRDRKRGLLMLVCAAVFLGNAAIFSQPLP